MGLARSATSIGASASLDADLERAGWDLFLPEGSPP
jgi:hypothetical protein